jgi:thiol:disulfide interchange protein DsbA
MQRRFLTQALGSLSISCLVGQSAQAQTKPGSTGKPDSDNRPFRAVSVAEDSRRVLFFFDFACPFCAAYHESLLNFAATVPSQIQTLFIPVVNIADTARKQEQMIAAKCYYAAFSVATKPQMAKFTTSVYGLYQQTHSLMDKQIWSKSIKAAGIDTKKFLAALNSASGDTQLKFAARKVFQYGLRATPSVAVAGRYVITPDDVAGDQEAFFNILNGLTSEVL